MNGAKPIIVSVSRHFDAPAEAVYDAWLKPEAARNFLFRTDSGVLKTCEIDARVGGEFLIVEQRGEVTAEHFGKYLELDRPRRIAFTFAAVRDQSATRVQLDIVPDGTGCTLTLTHEMDPQWADFKDRTEQGWTMILEKLAQVVG